MEWNLFKDCCRPVNTEFLNGENVALCLFYLHLYWNDGTHVGIQRTREEGGGAVSSFKWQTVITAFTKPLPKTKHTSGEVSLWGVSSSSSFLKLVVLPCTFFLILLSDYYQSSRVRSRRESRGPPADACHAPRLWRPGVRGEFCFSLLGGSAFKSSRAP